MPNATFPRMLTDYLRRRAAHLFPPRELELLRLHLIDRLRRVEKLPSAGGGIDWAQLAQDAGVDARLMLQAKEALRPGLEALRREIAARPKPKAPKPPNPRARAQTPVLRRRPGGGRKPMPTIASPEANDDVWDDPATFQEALALHMRRHRDTSVSLTRAIVEPDDTLETSTIVTWRNGRKAPRSLASFDILRRIERRYRLPPGYFQAKLPHPARAATGHRPAGVSSAELRRLAWHLPDDFGDRPLPEQEEILEWVRRVVISGSTDYMCGTTLECSEFLSRRRRLDIQRGGRCAQGCIQVFQHLFGRHVVVYAVLGN